MKNLLQIISFLVFSCIACNKKENKSILLESGNDTLIAQMVRYDAENKILDLRNFKYDQMNRLSEVHYRGFYYNTSYTLFYRYYHNGTLTVRSAEDYPDDSIFFDSNHQTIKSVEMDQTITFLYDSSNRLSQEIWDTKGDTTMYSYKWENGNIRSIMGEFENGYSVKAVYTYNETLPVLIGDVHYMDFLLRGINTTVRNRHQCISLMYTPPNHDGEADGIEYSYDSKGRLSGYTMASGESVKYAYR